MRIMRLKIMRNVRKKLNVGLTSSQLTLLGCGSI